MKSILFMMTMLVVLFPSVAFGRIGVAPKTSKSLEPGVQQKQQDSHRFQRLSVEDEAEEEEEEEEAGGVEDDGEVEDTSNAPCVEDPEHVGSGTGYVVKCGDKGGVVADASSGDDEEEEEEEEAGGAADEEEEEAGGAADKEEDADAAADNEEDADAAADNEEDADAA